MTVVFSASAAGSSGQDILAHLFANFPHYSRCAPHLRIILFTVYGLKSVNSSAFRFFTNNLHSYHISTRRPVPNSVELNRRKSDRKFVSRLRLGSPCPPNTPSPNQTGKKTDSSLKCIPPLARTRVDINTVQVQQICL